MSAPNSMLDMADGPSWTARRSCRSSLGRRHDDARGSCAVCVLADPSRRNSCGDRAVSVATYLGAIHAVHGIMPFPLNVTFRDMAPSPAIEEFIREWAVKLEHVYPRIERGHVVIERPHQHHHQGQRVHVSVTLAVPGPDVIVSRDHALDGSHENIYVAIRDAFHAARRQLEDHARRQR